VSIPDPLITTLDVNSSSPAFAKEQSYYADFAIEVPLQYSFNFWTVYANGVEYKTAFRATQAIDAYAHDLPSAPDAARICSHNELIAYVAPCNPSTLLPYSLSFVFNYPLNDGFGTEARPDGISPVPSKFLPHPLPTTDTLL
jgi:hypothetical protein